MRADRRVVEGHRPGPTVWLWLPAARSSPSLLQAAAEVCDALDPAGLAGRVGLYADRTLHGAAAIDPATALPPDAAPHLRIALAAAREAMANADAVLALVERGADEARRLELDPQDTAARRVARATGVPLWVKRPVCAVGAPLCVYRDGLGARRPGAVVRATVDAARSAIESLLGGLGATRAQPVRTPLRIVVKSCFTVGENDRARAAEAVVAVGAVVRAGTLLARVGPPGRAREELRTPESGVVLTADPSPGAPTFVLGRLERTLARAERLLGGPAAPDPVTVGWCEWAALPDLGVGRIKAKLDTGARSCALHVVAVRRHAQRDGSTLLELDVPSGEGGAIVTARCPLAGETTVRASDGRAERRPYIRTALLLAGVAHRVLVTLTDRGDMRFPMLIGRAALAGVARVDPSARFLLGRR